MQLRFWSQIPEPKRRVTVGHVQPEIRSTYSSRIRVRLTLGDTATLPTQILLSQLHVLYDVIILTFVRRKCRLNEGHRSRIWRSRRLHHYTMYKVAIEVIAEAIARIARIARISRIARIAHQTNHSLCDVIWGHRTINHGGRRRTTTLKGAQITAPRDRRSTMLAWLVMQTSQMCRNDDRLC